MAPFTQSAQVRFDLVPFGKRLKGDSLLNVMLIEDGNFLIKIKCTQNKKSTLACEIPFKVMRCSGVTFNFPVRADLEEIPGGGHTFPTFRVMAMLINDTAVANKLINASVEELKVYWNEHSGKIKSKYLSTEVVNVVYHKES